MPTSEELQTMAAEMQEEEIFPGGPKASELAGWKETYPGVMMSTFDDGSVYIWRTMTRQQWKEAMKVLGQLPDMHTLEERMLEKILLFPKVNFMQIHDLPAGVPTTVVDQFTRACGFGPTEVVEL